jgi:2-keto-4-pentenoate hydratase/2-oxohepta-3-ene-1,7-dioic acid hydratase in catechol pathway
MRFCNFTSENELCGLEPTQAGILFDDGIRPLAFMLRNSAGLRMEGGMPLPLGFRVGDHNNLQELERWRKEMENPDPGRLEIIPALNPEEAVFSPPVFHPGSLRSFSAFENHARAVHGGNLPPEWYEGPLFHYSNPGSLFGHGENIPHPRYGAQLDCGIQVAAVIGRAGSDIPVDLADDYVAGFVILNDWTFRDVERSEINASTGPAKAGDFATSLGQYLVTPDELADRRDGNGYDLQMSVRINGEELWVGNWNAIHYSVGEMIARTSEGTVLNPGDILAGGTAGGSIIELGPENAGGWLEPGDVVELEVERLGSLRNRIVEP